MKKTFMGVRLKRLREQHNLNQLELAKILEISPSYLNQLEKNQRPLTVPVLLKIHAAFDVDVQFFSENDEARLIADLRECFDNQAEQGQVSLAEIKELASSMPDIANIVLHLAKSQRQAQESQQALAARLGIEGEKFQTVKLMPFEEVRDFFYANHNYMAALDEHAEKLAQQWQLRPEHCSEQLTQILQQQFDTHVVLHSSDQQSSKRYYQAGQKTLSLSSQLSLGQRAFQMATQIAYLTANDDINLLCEQANFTSSEAKHLARIGLANYFAGALVMPYHDFLANAEQLKYDIDLLGQRFQQGFEATCHRLSTLQKPSARGVPFFFIRVDKAGNISKRQSATDFHFSRIGGSCPLWNVYDAFEQPGKILTQLATMPDGRAYLWIAQRITHHYGGFGAPSKTFSIGLGCDIQHAERLIYSQGLDLKNRERFTPIGAGCKVCPRKNCPQRAFPMSGSELLIDENISELTPYVVQG